MNEIIKAVPYDFNKFIQEKLQKSISELQLYLNDKKTRIDELNVELEATKGNNFRGLSGQTASTIFETLAEFVKITSKLYVYYSARNKLNETTRDFDNKKNELEKKNIILEIIKEKEKLKSKLEAEGYTKKEIGEYLTLGMLDAVLLANQGKSYDELSDVFDNFIKFSIMGAVASQDKDLEEFINTLKEKKEEYINPKAEKATKDKKYTYKQNSKINKDRLIQKNRQR